MLFGHAKWFIDDSQPLLMDWGFFLDARTLVALAATLLVTALWWVVGPRVRQKLLPVLRSLGRLAQWTPRVLAGCLAIALILLAVNGRVLDPGTVAEGPPGVGLLVLQAVVGAWLLLGRRLRAAAGMLALLCLAAAALIGPMVVLESGHVVGVALYLYLGSGETGSDPRSTTAMRRRAAALGVSLGASLVVVAFTEKLGNPAVAGALLDSYPELNVVGALGVENETFIRLVGAAEVLVGVLLVTGVARELVAVGASLPFVATVPVFGVTELVGHLPIYAALFALAVDAVALEPAPAGRRLRHRGPANRGLSLSRRERGHAIAKASEPEAGSWPSVGPSTRPSIPARPGPGAGVSRTANVARLGC